MGGGPGGPRPEPAPELAPTVARLQFTERLTGFVSMSVPDDYTAGYDRGRADNARVDLLISIEYDDIQAALDDPAREARITGTVVAPALSARRLTVTEGSFALFDPDPAQVETWHMQYRMTLQAQEGKRYFFEGHKVIRENGVRHAWSETTTLYTTISGRDGAAAGYRDPLPEARRPAQADPQHQGRRGTAPAAGRVPPGVPRAVRGRDGAHLRRGARRGGGVPERAENGASGPRAQRPGRDLVVRRQQQWHADDRLGDDAFLRLTRYRAGGKGPLIMATGFGMSSHSFLASTIEQNLTEFLADQGYDIWLFDYRAGIDLPSSRTEFTIDDIARTDWPAAVKKVLEVTGRDDLQAFGHCVGSGSLQMAILAGLQGIRTAVCAQFPMHPSTSVFNRVKSRLHTAGAFRALAEPAAWRPTSAGRSPTSWSTSACGPSRCRPRSTAARRSAGGSTRSTAAPTATRSSTTRPTAR